MANKISVVIPVYNSEKSLPELCKRLSSYADEIILVDDSSTDSSWQVMKKLESKKVRIVQLMRNFGQHNAIMAGLHYATGDFIVTMDDDLQHPPEEIPNLVTKIKEGYDIVYGQYKEKKHSILKNIGSKLTMSVLSRASGTRFEITAFRIMKKQLAEKLKNFKNYNVVIDVLLSNIVQQKMIAYVQVNHNPRKYGSSNYSFRKLVLFALNMIFNYTVFPLRIATIAGIFFSVFSFILALLYAALYFAGRIEVSGFTTLILSITFFSGIILFVLGIIGEYIGRIFLSVSNKPQFIIRENGNKKT